MTLENNALLLSSYHYLVWVVLIEIIVNTFSSSITYPQPNMTSQALPPNMVMEIDDFVSSNVDNYDDMRGYTLTSNKNPSMTISMSLSKVLVNYTTKMEQLNNVSDKTIFKELVDSL